METRYGLPIETWQAVKDEARRILIECAKNRQTITYSELSNQITAAHIPHHGFKMVGLLDEISSDEFAQGRAPLATLVVRKSDGLPGGGYFKKSFPNNAPMENLRNYWELEFESTCRDWQHFNLESRKNSMPERSSDD
jgi:hypothetical protein